MGGDVESVGLSEKIVDVGGAGILDGGEDDVIVAALGIGRGGVEERKEDLCHFGEVFVAEAGEDEGAGLGGGKLGDGGAEGPGAGGVMGDVEKELVVIAEGYKFQGGRASGCCEYPLRSRRLLSCNFCCYVIPERRRWRGQHCAAGGGPGSGESTSRRPSSSRLRV